MCANLVIESEPVLGETVMNRHGSRQRASSCDRECDGVRQRPSVALADEMMSGNL